jgi:hypothetical protein
MRLGLIAAVLAAALAALGAVVLAAGGIAAGGPGASRQAEPDAAAFARRVVRLIAENRYDQAWYRLHPSHQRSADRADYVMCENLSPIPGRVLSVSAGRPADDAVTLPSGRMVSSKAVPVEIVLRDQATREATFVATIVHAVPFGGGWRWILPESRLEAYAAGQCPGGGGPPR